MELLILGLYTGGVMALIIASAVIKHKRNKKSKEIFLVEEED